MELKIDNEAIAKMVQEQIKVAAAAALSAQSPVLIQHIVDTAMNTKVNSYDRQTVFEAAIGAAIRAEAKAALDQWVADNKPKIQAQVYAALNKQTGLAKSIADKLVLGLTKDLDVVAYLKSKD